MMGIRWVGVVVGTAGWAVGQGVPVAARPARVLPGKAITFTVTKPALGLPEGSRDSGLCSSDGLTYFGVAGEEGKESAALDVYRVAKDGEVRHLRRVAPLDFTSYAVRDFYAGDQTLVTLVEGDRRDERDPKGKPREREFFLSLIDHDGDGGKLVKLDTRFTPLRVGMFGSGDFVVLGWEEGNELEKLAVVKEDGSLRRFIEPTDGKGTLAGLAGAKFVPFGGGVMLTFPGTGKAIRMLTASGHEWPVQLDYPAGWVLHDVLNSGGERIVVARVQEGSETGKPEGKTALRMFEFNAMTGARLREITFATLSAGEVTCAGGGSVTAVFEEAVGEVGTAKRVVVGTVRR